STPTTTPGSQPRGSISPTVSNPQSPHEFRTPCFATRLGAGPRDETAFVLPTNCDTLCRGSRCSLLLIAQLEESRACQCAAANSIATLKDSERVKREQE